MHFASRVAKALYLKRFGFDFVLNPPLKPIAGYNEGAIRILTDMRGFEI